MSQNNYIDFLRDTTILKEPNDLPSILNASEYIKFKGYSVEKDVPNTKLCYSELLPNGSQNIFDIKRNVSYCPDIQMCLNTNTRPNRILRSPQLPVPTQRFNKNPTEKTCACNNEKNLSRKCRRVGRISKCRTRVCDCNVPQVV
jgi:hypothetical protein